ncbi:MAG TPA: chemotaxis protein CheW [Acidimicrobiales bacterium]
MATERLYATFYVNGAHYGVDALDVQEVLRQQPMTRVPLTPEEVRGLINLRGQVVIAIDLRRRLGLEPLPDDQQSMNLVVHSDDGPVSLLVDHIGDVLRVEAEELEPAPQTVPQAQRELLLGVLKLESGLLHVLDVARATAPTAVVG